MKMIRTLTAALLVSAGLVHGLMAEDATAAGPGNEQGANFGFLSEKIKNHDKVFAGFIGGSITCGSGASAFGNNYYWLTRLWLKDRITGQGGGFDADTAAIGGTNSVYGAYRIGAQLLRRNPDLLIVEYAVNDNSIVPYGTEVLDGMEGMVRQALACNPKMTIVFFYTTTADLIAKYYSKGLVPPATKIHHMVAQRYGLLEVDAGSLVAKELKDGTFTNKDFFADGVHPKDIGHAFYAKVLTQALQAGLERSAPATVQPLPPPAGDAKYEYARLDPVIPEGSAEGWTVVKNQWNWNGVELYKATAPGKPLTFKVKGGKIQLVFEGRLKVSWMVNGADKSQEIKGHDSEMPMPANWAFPEKLMPSDGSAVTVEALPAPANGKFRAEIWGIFSIRKPDAK